MRFASLILLIMALCVSAQNDLQTQIGHLGSGSTDKAESARAVVSSDKGESGTDGTGAVLTGAGTIDTYSEWGFVPRQVYVETAGNLCFQTPDGEVHVLPVNDNSWVTAIFFAVIYEASHATYPTTATGCHFF